MKRFVIGIGGRAGNRTHNSIRHLHLQMSPASQRQQTLT
uniref:Nicotinamide riboside kinase 1 n=1 Tax=Mus musculus TaxID=10090 RepID=E0CZA2_MOUSE